MIGRAVNDDHRDSDNHATVINIGETVNGEIEIRDDVDVFRFDPIPGTKYEISTSLGSLPDSKLRVSCCGYAFGDHKTDSDSGDGKASRLHWTAQNDSPLFITVSSENESGTGDYNLTISVDEDDHSDQFQFATPLTIGENIPGTLELVDDTDMFTFYALAGQQYEFTASGPGHPNLYLKVSRPSVNRFSGRDFIYRVADDRDSSNRLLWTALEEGRCYLSVSSLGAVYDGEYTVTSRLLDDDHGSVRDFATPVSIDSTTHGSIDFVGDIDFLSFEAIAGERYEFHIESNVAHTPTLQLQNGFREAFDLEVSEAGKAYWIASRTGQFNLSIAYNNAERVAYRLRLRLIVDDHGNRTSTATSIPIGSSIDGTIEYSGDNDWFEFDVTEGTRYRVELNSTADASLALYSGNGRCLIREEHSKDGIVRFRWIADSTGTLKLRVVANQIVDSYSLSTESLGRQIQFYDESDRIHDSVNVTGAFAVEGKLHSNCDRDYFAIDLEAGQRYRFDLRHDGKRRPRLALFNERGGPMRYGGSTISGIAGASRRYYVAVLNSFPTSTSSTLGGRYRILIDVDSFDDSNDEYASRAHPESAAKLNIGEAVEGRIRNPYQSEFFAFEAKVGKTYSFQTRLGTLSKSSLAILNRRGTRQFRFDYDGGPDQASQLRWTAPRSDTFLVRVNTFGSRTGSYVLDSSLITSEHDDHGNQASKATPIEVGSTAAGLLGPNREPDWFRIDVVAGRRYRFQLLRDSITNVAIKLYAADGQTLLHSDRDRFGRLDGRIDWHALESGQLFLKVRASQATDYGSYRIESQALPNSFAHGFVSTSATDQGPSARSGIPRAFLRVDPISPVYVPLTDDDNELSEFSFDDVLEDDLDEEEVVPKRRRRFQFFSLAELLESVFEMPFGFLRNKTDLMPPAVPEAVTDLPIQASSNETNTEPAKAENAEDILKWLESIYLPEEPVEVEAVAPQNRRAETESMESVIN